MERKRGVGDAQDTDKQEIGVTNKTAVLLPYLATGLAASTTCAVLKPPHLELESTDARKPKYGIKYAFSLDGK